ncbi:histidine phosphatase family protein [Streptosporangium sp. NPDC051022]|uniref:histidine phosphatase family protein n=1 Tax=Streptosporangium sp. NPDC051022 TaxID=3155752 RepID=UPI00342901FD
MPSTITAVRHGQSESNVAFARAEADGVAVVLTGLDEDVPLTLFGRGQATALGRRLAEGEAPEVVWCSPYLRAVQTWELAAAHLDASPEVRLDARLGDRRMGRLAGMNLAAIRESFPEEADRLLRSEHTYRAPDGESFSDVADRVREVVAAMRAECAGRRVLVVAHDTVVLMFKHVIEGIPLDSVVVFAPVLNASLSVWRGSRPEIFNDDAHLRDITV